MPATVVLGAQWGDEGKGKLVDSSLGESATSSTTVMCRAGEIPRWRNNNAGSHTVVLGDKVLKFHLLPSGKHNP